VGKDFLIFPKLRKHDYTVSFKLTEEQKKLYRIEGERSRPWSHNPYGDNEVIFKVIAMKLVRLEVEDTHDLTGGHSWCVADAVKKVRVRAITEPNDKKAWAQLKWKGASPTGDNNEALVNIKDTGDFVVEATLDAPQSVTIEVYDILKVDCPLPKKLSASKWKSYVSNDVTRMKVTTEPNEDRVWKHLTWSEGTPTASKNESDVVLNPKGDRTVKAFLDGKPAEGILHICQWPRLEIQEVTFGGGHKVLNDGVAEIGVAFDRKWIEGRADAAPNKPAADSQPPICFTRGKHVGLAAKFKVAEFPTEDETVTVRGTGDFGEVQADIVVHAAGPPDDMPEVQSSGVLNDYVDCDDFWTIKWEYKLQDGSWADANSTEHLLYLTLDDPLKDIYFTLLDMSCRNARWQDTEEDFADSSFNAFQGHNGDNNGIPRKGDGKLLSYYLTGYKTSGGNDAQTTAGILGSPQATGRCGGWSVMLLHMWKMHGINTAVQRWYIRDGAPAFHDDTKRFLVKNCDFTAVSDNVGRYSHKGKAAIKLVGVPGQGKTNPQFDFGDHVVVKFNNKLYDPSYGLGPYDTDTEYLAAALDGLASMQTGEVTFKMADTVHTPQFISNECVPYAAGFASYTIKRQTLQEIADLYGEADDILLILDSALSMLRADANDVMPGDTVVVPVHIDGTFDIAAADGYSTSHTLVGVTFDTIAALHNVTKQAIFDDPANAALKLSRGTPAFVTWGDVVYVTPASAPGGDWVVGHDL
jgi:hypothetical protein